MRKSLLEHWRLFTLEHVAHFQHKTVEYCGSLFSLITQQLHFNFLSIIVEWNKSSKMEAGTNFLTPLFLRDVKEARNLWMLSWLLSTRPTNFQELIYKEICQASLEIKYNNTHIEYAKIKGGRSVKYCPQHPIYAFFASCKDDDPVELEVIIYPELFQKPYPKDVLSTMIAALTPNRTMLTSKFSVWNFEEFQTAYETAANKESFLKNYATASREEPSIHNQIESVVVDMLNSHKLGFVDTNSGERENAYNNLKAAVDSFTILFTHRRKLPKYNIMVFKTSILGRIKHAITAKVKSTTKVQITK